MKCHVEKKMEKEAPMIKHIIELLIESYERITIRNSANSKTLPNVTSHIHREQSQHAYILLYILLNE